MHITLSLVLPCDEASIPVVRHLSGQVRTNEPIDLEADGGRGVRPMRALVDQVRFESKPQEGTVVCLEKQLVFDGHSRVVAAARR